MIAPVDQVHESQAGKELVIDELFESLRPYFTRAMWVSQSVGLTLTLYGGRWFGGIDIDPDSVVLAANATTYVEADATTGDVTGNTTGYSSGAVPLGVAVTNGTGRVSYTAEPRAGGGVIGGGGGSGPKVVQLAASDESSAIAAGSSLITFRMPFAMTLSAVRASLSTAQASGATFTATVRQNGTAILSTAITIDNGEKTSTTAATAPVISVSALTDDAEMTVDVTQVGNGTAKGLKVSLIGA